MKITAAGSLPGDDFRGALAAMAEHFPEAAALVAPGGQVIEIDEAGIH